jgi:hypothetical protein
MTTRNVLIVGSPGAGKAPTNFASLMASLANGTTIIDPHSHSLADDPTDSPPAHEPAPGSEPSCPAEETGGEGHSQP